MTDTHTIQADVTRTSGATGSLDQMFDFADAFCQRQFKHTGVIYPMFHAETESDTFIIRTMMEHKQAVAEMLTDYFSKENVQRFVMIDEAWILNCKVEIGREALDEIMRVGLKNHPDRIEVVMLHAQDITHLKTGRRKIIRPKKGKAKLGPLVVDDMSAGPMESRWSMLLNHLRTGRLQ